MGSQAGLLRGAAALAEPGSRQTGLVSGSHVLVLMSVRKSKSSAVQATIVFDMYTYMYEFHMYVEISPTPVCMISCAV